jgi:hypothetical protein
MSFRKGDLIVVAAVLVAAGFLSAAFFVPGKSADLLNRLVVSPVGEFGQSVSGWWNQPSAAQLTASLTACEAVLSATQGELKLAREMAEVENLRHCRLNEAFQSQVEVAEMERDRTWTELQAVKAELAGARARYGTLCNRLLELGNDVPSVLAGE